MVKRLPIFSLLLESSERSSARRSLSLTTGFLRGCFGLQFVGHKPQFWKNLRGKRSCLRVTSFGVFARFFAYEARHEVAGKSSLQLGDEGLGEGQLDIEMGRASDRIGKV